MREPLRRLGLQDLPQARALIIRILKGTVLFRAGDACRGYPVVLTGEVRVCRIGPFGHDVVFYRVREGEGCAVSAGCLMEEQRYPVFGVAERETTALFLPASVFREQLDTNVAFRAYVFGQYAMRVGMLMTQIDSLISEGPSTRLARHLLARMQGGTVTMTHAELAADIGTAREVVSRHLGTLVRAGWIRQRRQVIDIIDAGALQALAHTGQ
ncbi:MAG TPA: Crp/Fnr family transcriptional regulator [Dyella sp.]|nr:Crp/Fnr family transcriptional regulator [Dyella sp.]